MKTIFYTEIPSPEKDCALPVDLTDETIAERKEKILSRMQEKGLDKLIVYCDVEHAGNFSYLVGFYTRFGMYPGARVFVFFAKSAQSERQKFRGIIA